MMQPIGYRGAVDSYAIDSSQFQFSFYPRTSDYLLGISFRSVPLGKIERVNFYLDNGLSIHHVFIVDGKYAYYYEPDKMIEVELNDYVYAPPVQNIYDRFEFDRENVVLIRRNNVVRKFWSDWHTLLSISYLWFRIPRLSDGPASIKYNTECFVEQFSTLPEQSSEDLFRRE